MSISPNFTNSNEFFILSTQRIRTIHVTHAGWSLAYTYKVHQACDVWLEFRLNRWYDTTGNVFCWLTFALAGTIFCTNGTVSFSEDIMPTISCESLNSNLAIPSKHFFRWGWTRSGSFVSDRISSNSSFDRKKNLEWEKHGYNVNHATQHSKHHFCAVIRQGVST